MWKIKQRTQLTKIILYSGDPVITEIDKSEIDKSLNADWKFMIFWDRTLNKSNIKEVSKFEANDIDSFILSQPKEIREKLTKELNIRKEKWLNTNVAILEWILERI